jgi:hypothetical protein
MIFASKMTHEKVKNFSESAPYKHNSTSTDKCIKNKFENILK